MKQTLTILAAIAAVSPAIADDHKPQGIYLTPQIVGVDVDDDRIGTQEAKTGYGLNFILGKPLSGSFNVEGRLFVQSAGVKGSDDKVAFVGAGVDLMLIKRNDGIQPFATLGVGGISTDIRFNGIEESEDIKPFAALGFGAMLPVNSNFQLRSDVRYRVTFDDEFVAGEDRFDDLEVGLGLNIPFGQSQQVAVARAPEPVIVTIADTDNDGIEDEKDSCPNTQAGLALDDTGCERDTDNDGIYDRFDQCPGTATNKPVDGNGCVVEEIIRLDGVQFMLNSSSLKTDTVAALNKAVVTLRENTSVAVEVAGHSDSIGDAKYNLWLSQRRAEAVRTFLMNGGIDGERITAVGYGETQPEFDNLTPKGRIANRRVELRTK
jgi:OOP family OmpA-OmpF porin